MLESSSNYYSILGCNKDSSQDDIKHAYHKQALQFHPDKNGNKDNIVKFQQIDKAWKVLRDPLSRSEYDVECRQTELETQSVLIYARISSKDLELTEREDMLMYRCRCSGHYFINNDDLKEKNTEIHVPCQECTFNIIVET